MNKTFIILALFALLVGNAFADEPIDKDKNSKGKTISVQGTLVDTDCYFKEGQTGDEHDGMVGCGKACLISGVPAGVLVGDKVYVLIFPSKAFADVVGKTVEIEGEPYGDNLIHPQKAVVIDKGGKKTIKLRGFEIM